MPDNSPAEAGLRIFKIRERLVVLDSDLAALYGVVTGNFNKAVARNQTRFPADFGFALTRTEYASLLFQIGIAKGRGGRRTPPRVFTEHGAIMAAGILNSPRAVAMSVAVVRAFVSMRRELASHADLERRLVEAEKVLLSHDSALRDLYAKLRPLILPPNPPRRRIGFGKGD